MRVAICISGEMRNFENQIVVDSYSTFINSLENQNYTVDVFISTWSHIGVSHNTVRNDITANRDDTCDTLVDRILGVYRNVVSYEIHNYNDWLKENPVLVQVMKTPLIGGESVTAPPQLYKIYKCNELKKVHELSRNFEYDTVIRTRPDMVYLDNTLSTNKTVISHINFGRTGAYWPNRIYDVFFYSSSRNMDLLCSTWLSILDDIDHSFDNGLDKRDCCRLLYLNCLKNNIRVNDLTTRTCVVHRGESVEALNDYVRFLDNV